MKLKRIVLGMVVITMFISLTGCKQQTDKPFTIKETKITHKIIPYDSRFCNRNILAQVILFTLSRLSVLSNTYCL